MCTKQTIIVSNLEETLETLFFQIVKVERFVCMHNANESFKVLRFCKMFVVVKCTLSCFSRRQKEMQ